MSKIFNRLLLKLSSFALWVRQRFARDPYIPLYIPKQIEDVGFMASRFVAILLLGRQSELALPAKAEKKKEVKDVKEETDIFNLLGYIFLSLTNFFLPPNQNTRFQKKSYCICLLSILFSATLSGAIAKEAPKKVLISKIVDHPALDKTAKGILKGLRDKGYEEGKNLEVRIESAQADARLAQQIASKYINQNPDVVVGIGTLAAQSFAAAALAGKIKLVFSSVTDPIKAGLVKTLEQPGNNTSGVSNYVDLQPQLELFFKIQPGLKRLGFLYNPGEANSVILKDKLAELCSRFNLTLVEQTVNKTADIMQNATKLAYDCDAIFVSNDSTVLSSLPAVVSCVRAAKIPLYVSDTDAVALGAVAALGPNQTEIGVQTGYMIANLLNGEDIASKPVEFPLHTDLYLNRDAARRAGITFPEEVIKSATSVMDTEVSSTSMVDTEASFNICDGYADFLISGAEFWTSLEIGLIYGIVAVGVFLTFRIIDFPDLTCDGTFACGAATCAILLKSGMSPLLALGLAGIAGGVAGLATGLLHVGLRVTNLLSGILIAFMLYSINLKIMGGVPNIALLNEGTLFTPDNGLWVLLIAALAVGSVICFLLMTDWGLALRSIAYNKLLAKIMGVKVGLFTVVGLIISNALIGLGGGLYCQHQGFSDVSLGVGTVIIGLAAVMIGEKVLPLRSMMVRVAACFAGSIIYRLLIATALHSEWLGLQTSDLNLLTGLAILGIMALPKFKGSMSC